MTISLRLVFLLAVGGHHKRLGSSVFSVTVYSKLLAGRPTALVIEAKRFIWSQALRSRSDREALADRGWTDSSETGGQQPVAVFHPPFSLFIPVSLLRPLLPARRVSLQPHKVIVSFCSASLSYKCTCASITHKARQPTPDRTNRGLYPPSLNARLILPLTAGQEGGGGRQKKRAHLEVLF